MKPVIIIVYRYIKHRIILLYPRLLNKLINVYFNNTWDVGKNLKYMTLQCIYVISIRSVELYSCRQ